MIAKPSNDLSDGSPETGKLLRAMRVLGGPAQTRVCPTFSTERYAKFFTVP
jgi:hypothetical protein